MNVLTLVAALALTMTSFGLTSASEEPRYYVVLDTPEGLVERVMTESELRLDAHRCTVDAPSSAVCVNGPVVRRLSAGHGLALPIPSGSNIGPVNHPVKSVWMASFLTSDADTSRLFRCEIREGLPGPLGGAPISFACYAGSGTFPPIGSQMTQTAYGLLRTEGGAADTLSLDILVGSDNAIVLPGLGLFQATLTH